jgi:hypothetical protein
VAPDVTLHMEADVAPRHEHTVRLGRSVSSRERPFYYASASGTARVGATASSAASTNTAIDPGDVAGGQRAAASR